MTGIEQGEASGDGSKMEEMSCPVSMDTNEALDVVRDSIFHAIILRLVI